MGMAKRRGVGMREPREWSWSALIRRYLDNPGPVPGSYAAEVTSVTTAGVGIFTDLEMLGAGKVRSNTAGLGAVR